MEQKKEMDYNSYIEIADGIYWVGFADENAGLHCNPYLIVDGNEAVLIDGGSRGDFSTVMLKIMRTGTNPKQIQRLIYQHYDPDLCGNIPHLEAIIDNPNLRILSHAENNIFINYYSTKLPKDDVQSLGLFYEFGNGRRLEFCRTPYAHSTGSFVTYDTKTKTLFSSDIFGSYDSQWDLFSSIQDDCLHCTPGEICPQTGRLCEITGIYDFTRRIMTSTKALNHALDQMERWEINMIAPQHGSILHTAKARDVVIQKLRELTDVGIDRFLKENPDIW